MQLGLSSADDIVIVLTCCTLTSSLDVIVCQSVVRRYIATKNVDILRQGRCMRAATVIQARWRTYDATENFTRVQMKVAFLQSLFRRWKARRYLQGCKSAATKITSTWKMINCRMAYNQIVNGKRCAMDLLLKLNLRLLTQTLSEYFPPESDIIICQTIVRRNIASRKIEQIRHERRMVSATLIQARWRAYKASKGFLQIKLQVTLLQSVTHRWRAEKYLAQNKNAATKIAACWRRFYCLMSTMKIRRGELITASGIKFVVQSSSCEPTGPFF